MFYHLLRNVLACTIACLLPSSVISQSSTEPKYFNSPTAIIIMLREAKAGALRTQDHFRDRTTLVKETQELLSLNEKIKAAIMLNKLEKFGELSNYIKKRVLGNKVKRTIQLRSKYSGNFNNSNSSIKRNKATLDNQASLTIDTTDIGSSPGSTKKFHLRLPDRLSPKKQRHSVQVETVFNKSNKRYSSVDYGDEDPTDNLGNSLNLNESETYPSRKISMDLKIKPEDVPFILKNRTKKQMRKFLTISKDYTQKIAQIDETSRFEEELRKDKQRHFYSRIRNPKLYYQMIEKIRFPLNLDTIKVDVPSATISPSLLQPN